MIQLRRALLLAFALSGAVVTNAIGAAGATSPSASQAVSEPAGPAVASAAGSAAQPTPAQVRKAVQRALHSRKLWATINICDRPHGIYQNTIGIRGQIPALGFGTRFGMKVAVLYWSSPKKRFLVDPFAEHAKRLGPGTTGAYQWGANFKFNPTLRLSGQVTFKWIYKGKVIGTATRMATAGHHDADRGIPKGYSAATCRIRKP
jgi:hypothetical protein